jgi:phosphoserine phosphatase
LGGGGSLLLYETGNNQCFIERSWMIVISDMMGTLTTGSPILGLVDWIRHHQSRAEASWLIAKILPVYLLAKAGLLDAQAWKQKMMVESLSWIKDADPEIFTQVCDWTVEHNLWPKRRPEVIARLEQHIHSGDRVYIASSVFELLTETFAARFGALSIGTPVTIENGHVRLASGVVSGERKIHEVLSRLGVSRVDYTYGDTYMDIPLLVNADHPVAVYPDRRLHAMAKERGWEIIS